MACFGQCALAPVVEIDHRICGHMNERALEREVEALEQERVAMSRIEDIGAFNAVREAGLAKLLPPIAAHRRRNGHLRARQRRRRRLSRASPRRSTATGAKSVLASVGCFGAVLGRAAGQCVDPGTAAGGAAARAGERCRAHPVTIVDGERITPDLAWCKVEEWDHITAHVRYGHGYPGAAAWYEVPFFTGQKKIVLRNCGLIDPGRHRGIHRAWAVTRRCIRC